MIDEFVERMIKRKKILTIIKERYDSTEELSKKCDYLINEINETILVYCSKYN